MNLTGWQLVVALFVGAALGVTGAAIKSDALITLAGTVLGGVLGLMQPGRSPESRTRSTDKAEEGRRP